MLLFDAGLKLNFAGLVNAVFGSGKQMLEDVSIQTIEHLSQPIDRTEACTAALSA